jgi:prephenate dehydratase
MTVAFQGEIGAFSEEAARRLFEGAEPVPRPTFEEVFAAVAGGEVDAAVIPIENSLFGSVHVNYDLLRTHDLRITSELQLRIRHHLMARPGTRIEDVCRVHSHPQALGQCQIFLREHLPHADVIPAYDTAGAAKMVAGAGAGEAAIASEQAAAEYGLEIIAAGIESNHQNFTRFLALAPAGSVPDRVIPDRPYKTSLVYSMRTNVPGALFKSLAVFALRDIDLYKIESRPLVGSPGNYLFYLDVEGAADDEPVQRALEHLEELASYLRVLGSYPRGNVE